MTAITFREKLASLLGTRVGSGSHAVGPDPVNQPMIRHWAAAFEDDNPVYTDPEFAAASRFGGIVAPPLMLQTWTMATPTITGIAERGGSPVEIEGESPLAVLDDAGFVGTLASNSEFEIERYLRLGEVISADDGDRVGLGREADPDRPGALRHLGDHLRQRRAARSSAARRSGSSSSDPTVSGARRELPAWRRPVTPDTQFFWDGDRGAPTADPTLRRLRRAAPPAPARCARAATRWRGTRSRRRVGARSSAS